MPLDETFVKEAVQAEAYELSLHADEKRLHDHLSITDIEEALRSCEILERYREDPRGESCLVLGFCGTRPVHIVCGKTRQNKLFLITVYLPTEPKWTPPPEQGEKERARHDTFLFGLFFLRRLCRRTACPAGSLVGKSVVHCGKSSRRRMQAMWGESCAARRGEKDRWAFEEPRIARQIHHRAGLLSCLTNGLPIAHRRAPVVIGTSGRLTAQASSWRVFSWRVFVRRIGI